MQTKLEISPQPGPQTAFLSTPADIAITGGGAGGGKTWAMLMEPLRHIKNPNFGAVIFRESYPQITQEGGLWDESHDLYQPLGARPLIQSHEWKFKSGAKIKFAYMATDEDRYQWDGSQIALIEFDQLERFTWKQFSYMFSRNRTDCGVRPYMRGSCNPDPDCFLRSLMDWWIDNNTGLAIPERSGKIRYFISLQNEIFWADTPDELIAPYGADSRPLSFTFIPSSVYDNKILLQRNPGYLASLKGLPLVDRERLLGCNWNIRWTAGKYFRREWFEIVDVAPVFIEVIRYWDRAATDSKKAKETGSWTVGLKLGKTAAGQFFVIDVIRFQGTPLAVRDAIKNTATQDGHEVRIGIEQDPGQAGVAEADDHVRNLIGYNVKVNKVHEAKGMRAKPVSAQAEAGNIKILRGEWNAKFIDELMNFDGTPASMADQVDTLSGAFMMLAKPVSQKPEITSGDERQSQNDLKGFGFRPDNQSGNRIKPEGFGV
jgi:predicted phage terminase large subunit-like protein